MTVSAFSLYLTEELGVMGMFESGVVSLEGIMGKDGLQRSRKEQGTAVGKILGSGVFASLCIICEIVTSVKGNPSVTNEACQSADNMIALSKHNSTRSFMIIIHIPTAYQSEKALSDPRKCQKSWSWRFMSEGH